MVPYDLKELPRHVQDALDAAPIRDATLRKAGAYFRQALFLHQEAWKFLVPGSFQWGLAISDAVLNYHKSVSSILGDPSQDRDYQKRYATYRICKALWEEAEQLRDIRNSRGVAHYAKGQQAIDVARSDIDFAKETAGKILNAYLVFLRGGAASSR